MLTDGPAPHPDDYAPGELAEDQKRILEIAQAFREMSETDFQRLLKAIQGRPRKVLSILLMLPRCENSIEKQCKGKEESGGALYLSYSLKRPDMKTNLNQWGVVTHVD